MKSRFAIFSTLIILTFVAWSYIEGQSVAFLILMILMVTGIYMLGAMRLWRSAGLGHGLPVWRAACFLGGMGILVLALFGPIDELADKAFSMHMVQHMLLIKVAPPLLLLGELSPVFLWAIGKNTAHRAAGTWTRSWWLGSFWKQLTNLWVTWMLFALCLWVWHIPAFYQAALNSESLHDLEHILFLGTSLLFWWYLLQTGPGQATRYGTAVLYLFTTLLNESVLGALLTFSSSNWYSFYSAPNPWGLSALSDQQLAGMIMWLPGGIIFGLLIVLYFGAWLRAIEKRMQGTHPELAQAGDRND